MAQTAGLDTQLFKPLGHSNSSRAVVGHYTASLNPFPGASLQADLLMLPEENGFRYALVVVDIASRTTDAEPLKSKQPVEVLAALRRVWARNLKKGGLFAQALGKPPQLRFEIDGGSEFKGVVKEEIEKNGCTIKVARPGRHEQLGMVESRNHEIGRQLGKLRAARELLTDIPTDEWLAFLPSIIKRINERLQRPGIVDDPDAPPVAGTGQELVILTPGTPVRVALERDRPAGLATGVKLGGVRRATDPVWDWRVREVIAPVFTPGQVVRYVVSGFPDVHFKRQELQVVSPSERYPLSSDVYPNGNQPAFVPLKIHARERRGLRGAQLAPGSRSGTWWYLTEWRGLPQERDFTWEPAAELKKSTVGAKLVEAWDAKH